MPPHDLDDADPRFGRDVPPAVSRAAGFNLGPIADVLPIVMNVVASAGGIASGLLLGVERPMHVEARFNKRVA